MKAVLHLRQLALWLLLASAAGAETFQVVVRDDEFVPKNLTVAPGDTVVWTMVGGNSHTVTAINGEFDSGQPFPQNTTYAAQFTEQKRYPYQCSFHLGEMTGLIRVVDASANVAPSMPVNQLPANGASNLSVSPTLTASLFADANEGDEHAASQWIIRNSATGEIVRDIVQTLDDTATLRSIKLTGLNQATTYSWQVRYRDDVSATAWSEYSEETLFTTVSAPTSTGTGLSATYGAYVPAVKAAGKKAAKPEKFTVKGTEIDSSVDFDWKLGRYRNAPANNFFVRWEGKLLPEFSERYRLRVKADGAVRLWVNNVRVIDDYDYIKTPFAVYRSAVVSLQAGVPANLKLEYYDTNGNASAVLSWSSISLPTEVIPTDRLFPLTAP